MAGPFWRQGNPQSREVSQAEVDRAAGLNYIAAGPMLSAGMKRAGLNTDAANQMTWARKQAEYDLGQRPGLVQVGTDGQRHEFGPPGASAADVDRMAMENLGRTNPGYARFWQDPAERASSSPPRRSSVGAGDSGGSAGTYATINGRQMYVPKAGRYTTGEFEDELKGLSPELAAGSTYGVDANQLRNAQQAQMYLAAGQALPAHLRSPSLGLASDLQQKADMRKQLQGQKEFERQKELASIKNSKKPTAPKTPLEMRKNYLEGYRKEVDLWNQDQREAQKLQSRINAAVRQAGGDADKAMVPMGYHGGKPEKISVREARDILNQLQRPKPTREEYAALQGLDPSYLDPSLGQPSVYDAAVRAGEATSLADPALKERTFSSGYSASDLEKIPPAKRGEAIKRLRAAGDGEGASYLERLSSGRPSGRS